MKSYLTVELEKVVKEGWELVTSVDGQAAPNTKSSNLYAAMLDAEKKYPDCEIDYVVGGHRWHGADGWHMAVIRRIKQAKTA